MKVWLRFPLDSGRAVEFSTEDGLASVEDWPLVREYKEKLPRCEECDIIMLARPGTDDEAVRRAGWAAAGFDLGYFDSEWSHFSIVLNEVLSVYVKLLGGQPGADVEQPAKLYALSYVSPGFQPFGFAGGCMTRAAARDGR